MADIAQRLPDNVPGRYYVDATCIDCDLCREVAPHSFARNNKAGHSFVTKQPDTPEDQALCEAALAECPVEAIGNDGSKVGDDAS